MSSKKANEAKFKKKIQSSLSETSGESPFFYERKIITNGNLPLYFFKKKYKNLHDKNILISKTRRINKYNPKK